MNRKVKCLLSLSLICVSSLLPAQAGSSCGNSRFGCFVYAPPVTGTNIVPGDPYRVIAPPAPVVVTPVIQVQAPGH